MAVNRHVPMIKVSPLSQEIRALFKAEASVARATARAAAAATTTTTTLAVDKWTKLTM